MRRRTFLERGAGIAAGCLFGGRSAAESQKAQRFTTTTKSLERIDAARRLTLAENPEGLPPAELNSRVPEITAVELDNTLAAETPGETLRVVAWNIERGRGWRGAVKLMAEHDALRAPDVLLLSEMDIGMKRSGNLHTTRELAQAMGMNYAYAVEFLELPRGKDAAARQRFAEANPWSCHGNAILARFPLANARMVRFPGIEKWFGSGEHRLGGRNAVFAEITLGGRPVTLVATHLESGLRDNAARTDQARFILEELETYAAGQPVIAGGDLNSFHKAAAIQAFRDAGFCVDECNLLEQGTTQYTRDGEVRLGGAHIDYIMTRGFAPIQNATSPAVVPSVYPPGPEGKSLSDHAAVALRVRPA